MPNFTAFVVDQRLAWVAVPPFNPFAFALPNFTAFAVDQRSCCCIGWRMFARALAASDNVGGIVRTMSLASNVAH